MRDDPSTAARRLCRPTACVLLLLVMRAGSAHADDFTEAGFRFERGLEYLDLASARLRAGQPAAADVLVKSALGELLISQRLSPNVSTQLNVGWCLERLGRWDEAFGVYTEVGVDARSADDRRDLEVALARVEPHVATLAITTSPSGAALWIDREDLGGRGDSPRRLAVAPGERRIIARLPGYRTATATVAAAVRLRTAVHLVLVPETGRLEVRSAPSGAAVLLGTDTATRALTPAVLELPVGRHRLVLQLAGHQEARESVDIGADLPARFEARLTALPPPAGKLRVLASVDSALVELDGAEAGFTPFVADVAVGVHQLVVRRPGFQPFRTEVTIGEAHLTAYEVTMAPDLIEAAGGGRWTPILLGAGLASAAVGLGFGARALALQSDYADAPSRDLLDQGRTSARIADVTLLVGLGLGALGVLAWAIDDGERPETWGRVVDQVDGVSP